MCGIVGYIGNRRGVEVVVDGLRRLEYRGYDSAGIASLSPSGIEIRRSVGRIDNLARTIEDAPLAPSAVAIGHTRWATHGRPSIENAHPHKSGRVAIVHNGIIENHDSLRRELGRKGFIFSSQTDSEVVAHLVEDNLASGMDPLDAVKASVKRLEGAFALCVLIESYEKQVIVARKASPLAIGIGEGEMFIGSDAFALAPYTRKIVYLSDGDVAEVCATGAIVFDTNDNQVEREVKTTGVVIEDAQKHQYAHFMLKEIYEQPVVVRRILAALDDDEHGFEGLLNELRTLGRIERVSMIGCGTAHYATMVARYWFGKIAGVASDVEIASEFRYRETPIPDGTLGIFVSQSGETADTYAALRAFKQRGLATLGVVNVPESSIAREVDFCLPTRAGTEVSVASTKAFTAQLTVLGILAVAIGVIKGRLSEADVHDLLADLRRLPHAMELALETESACKRIGEDLVTSFSAPVYLGRGASFPLALEGALKIKEIAYVKAEGFAAGELKHGPIALIDEKVPAIILAPPDDLFSKTLGNLAEVAARGAHVVAVCDDDAVHEIEAEIGSTSFVVMPKVAPFTSPIVYSIPMQLIAYHAANHLGLDVDRPRNLAKSVTVE